MIPKQFLFKVLLYKKNLRLREGNKLAVKIN